MRFARLRMEKRHNYVRKVAETAVSLFITNDKVNVGGLVLAGSADFKNDLASSDMFDQRLSAKVIKIVDISYGGDNGFNQAIELAAEALSNVKFLQEKKLIAKFFDEVAQDTGKYVFGVEETLRALDMGAIETLIVYESLDVQKYELRHPITSEIKIIHLFPDQAKNEKYFKDETSGLDYEILSNEQLSEWLSTSYSKYGALLSFVTNKSQEGSQFEKGFGGIGGILRYKLEMHQHIDVSDHDIDEFI